MHDIIDRFKSVSKQTKHLVKMLQQYQKLTAEPVQNVYLLEKHGQSMEKHINALPEGSMKNELREFLRKEMSCIEENKEEFKIQFGQHLRRIFKEKSMEIRGQYPLLRVGLYTLKTDFEFGQAVLYFGPEVEKITSRIPLQPQIVFETVATFDADLRALERSPAEYVRDIYDAYIRSLRLLQKDQGQKVLLSEVLKEFILLQQPKRFFADPQKIHYRDFSRVKFSYLLYQIKQSGTMERGLRFHVATFDATTDKLHSLWIPENENGDGTHYSMISFEKEVR
jgi:hypothetical protein